MSTEHLQYYLKGNQASKNLILFLQGWPDNNLLWDWINWNEDLKDHALLFVNFPNTTPDQPVMPWGQNFSQIVQRLKITLDLVKKPDQDVTVVAHDWGCFYTYLFDQQYPGYFKEIITMDVAAYIQLTSVKQQLLVACYQIYLIVAFILGGWIGAKMTQALSKIFRHSPPYISQVTSTRNYPYFYLWKNMLLSKLGLERRLLREYVPSVPVVFLYGKRKPFQFHGSRWINYLQDNSKCELHDLDAGHWFMKKYATFITGLISRRITARL